MGDPDTEYYRRWSTTWPDPTRSHKSHDGQLERQIVPVSCTSQHVYPHKLTLTASEALMVYNGSTMCGHTILIPMLGHNSSALATFHHQEKDMQLHLSATLCIYLVVARKKEQIWVIWPPSESVQGDGIHSRTWVQAQARDLDTA